MKFLLFFLLFAHTISTRAQSVSFSQDPVAVYSNEEVPVKFDDGYLSIKYHKMKTIIATPFTKLDASKFKFSIYLQKYNDAMGLVKENDLSLSKLTFYYSAPVIKKLNNKMYLIYTDKSDEDESLVKKIAEINTNTLEPGTPKTLLKVRSPEFPGIDNRNGLHIQTSPDKSKILFQYDNGGDNIFTTCVTDNNLNILWRRNNEIDTDGGNLFVVSACVDNNGASYTAYKTGKSNFFLTGIDIKVRILICDQDQKNTINVTVADGAHQVLLSPSRTGNYINVAGTYFGNTDYISGVFSAKIDMATHKFNNLKKTAFEEKLIDLFTKDKLAFTAGKRNGIYPSSMQIYQLEDESIGIVGTIMRTDFYNSAKSQNYGGNSQTYVITGNILNVYFKKDQVVFSCIPKHMDYAFTENSTSSEISPNSFVEDWGYSSRQTTRDMFAYPVKNDLVIFYYDNEKNINQQPDQRTIASGSKSALILAMATISAEGSVKRTVLFDGKKEFLFAKLTLLQRKNANSLIMPIRDLNEVRKNKEKFIWGRIEIK